MGYLHRQAIANPVAFMGLLGKVLPLQMTGGTEGPLEVRWLPAQEPPLEPWEPCDRVRQYGPLIRSLNLWPAGASLLPS